MIHEVNHFYEKAQGFNDRYCSEVKIFLNQGNSGGIIDTAEFIMTTLALKRLASDSRKRNSVTVP